MITNWLQRLRIKPLLDYVHLEFQASDCFCAVATKTWTQKCEHKYRDNITSKGNNKLGFLKRNVKVNDSKLTAYKAIVRPSFIEYCSLVWDPHSAHTHLHSKGLEKVQQQAARWTTGRYHSTSSVTDIC